MLLNFEKYQGTGNDFIMIDNRSHVVRHPDLPVKSLCDRRFGIGADGIILLEEHPDLDFHMIYYNSDGSQSFCGNGSRCAMRFAQELGIIDQFARFLSTDGIHEALLLPDLRVELHMHNVTKHETHPGFSYAHTGSPHYICFRNNVDELNLIAEARAIRYSQPYREEGVNVNFVCASGNGWKMRTYERGVEDETLSCGTGVTAVALMGHVHKGGMPGFFESIVETPGGRLSVQFRFDGMQFTDIRLTGPAEPVFSGQVNLALL